MFWRARRTASQNNQAASEMISYLNTNCLPPYFHQPLNADGANNARWELVVGSLLRLDMIAGGSKSIEHILYNPVYYYA